MVAQFAEPGQRDRGLETEGRKSDIAENLADFSRVLGILQVADPKGTSRRFLIPTLVKFADFLADFFSESGAPSHARRIPA
jgi:hypothetical protein